MWDGRGWYGGPPGASGEGDTDMGKRAVLKRVAKWAAVLAVGGGVAWGVYRSGAVSAEHVAAVVTPTVKAKRADVEDTVLATGEVSPVDETQIRSEVSGQVTALQVQAGQRVAKDQPLLQLDRKELESEVHEDDYQIEADQLRAQQARKKLDRDKDLVGKGFIPQEEFDDADVALHLAENDLSVQRAKQETLRQKIVKTDLRAPHAGVVLKLDCRQGQVIIGADSVSSGTVLMRIADLTRLKVNTTLNEVDVAKVRVGAKVRLTFDAVPGRTIPGTITYISPSAESGGGGGGTGGGGDDEGGSSRGGGGSGGGVRGFETVITLDEADDRVRPGVTAHVAVPVAKAVHVVTVPLTAVFTDADATVAFVKHGAAFDKRPVDVGLSDGNVVEVKKGVADGDEVATERPGPPPAEKVGAD